MKLAEVDWGLLRGAVVLLVISAVVGAGAFALSYRFAERQESSLQRERARLLSARAQYHALDEEEDIIATYLPRYVELENLGVIGREQRLDWIDVLRESARDIRVPKLQYTIDVQRRFDTGLALDIGDYTVYASNMRLELGLLHEGDLVALFDRLRADVAGMFGVSACDLSRRGDTPQLAPEAVNVSARCDLNFITVRKADVARRS